MMEGLFVEERGAGNYCHAIVCCAETPCSLHLTAQQARVTMSEETFGSQKALCFASTSPTSHRTVLPSCPCNCCICLQVSPSQALVIKHRCRDVSPWFSLGLSQEVAQNWNDTRASRVTGCTLDGGTSVTCTWTALNQIGQATP